MNRVAYALMIHEFKERTKDKWILIICVLFASLSSAVTLYGQSAGKNAVGLTGPSLVTLASLFVPLVALVLSHDAIVGEQERNTLGLLLSLPISRFELVLSKFAGRGLALVFAVTLGVSFSAFFSGKTAQLVLLPLLVPTLLLGLIFLSIGMFLSSIVKRQTTAASLTVVVWFSLVFFYDLGLLALLVATKGAISQAGISLLVLLNPNGMYRLFMLNLFSGKETLAQFGMTSQVPSIGWLLFFSVLWIVIPLCLSGYILHKKKAI